MRNFFGALFAIERITRKDQKKLDKLKLDPEKAEKSSKFGIYSLILFIVGLAWSFAEFWIIQYIAWPIFKLAFSGFYLIIGNFALMAIALFIIIFPIYLNGWSRKYAKMQKELNDKKIGHVMSFFGLVGYLAVFSFWIFPLLMKAGVI